MEWLSQGSVFKCCLHATRYKSLTPAALLCDGPLPQAATCGSSAAAGRGAQLRRSNHPSPRPATHTTLHMEAGASASAAPHSPNTRAAAAAAAASPASQAEPHAAKRSHELGKVSIHMPPSAGPVQTRCGLLSRLECVWLRLRPRFFPQVHCRGGCGGIQDRDHPTCKQCLLKAAQLRAAEQLSLTPPSTPPHPSTPPPALSMFGRPSSCIDQLTTIERAAIVTLHGVGWTGRTIAQ